MNLQPIFDGPAVSYRPRRTVGGLTVRERAQDAYGVLEEFAEDQGLAGESLELITSDLVCDILHLATAAGLDSREFLLKVALKGWEHYYAESVAEPHEVEGEEDAPVEPAEYDPEDIIA